MHPLVPKQHQFVPILCYICCRKYLIMRESANIPVRRAWHCAQRVPSSIHTTTAAKLCDSSACRGPAPAVTWHAAAMQRALSCHAYMPHAALASRCRHYGTLQHAIRATVSDPCSWPAKRRLQAMGAASRALQSAELSMQQAVEGAKSMHSQQSIARQTVAQQQVPTSAWQTVAEQQPIKARQGSRPQDLNVLGRHSHRVIIAYEGTRFKGWQLQPDEPTVQREIERALTAVLKEDRAKLCVSAAGRTDAGVHAQGQVVQFYTDQEPDTNRLHLRMNVYLPPDVRAMTAHRTAPDFNVSISAKAKVYCYLIDTNVVHDPLTHPYRHHYRYPLNLAYMQQAAERFLGSHDFLQFSNLCSDTARRDPVKRMHRVDITHVDGGLQVEVEGAGFLYRQVRHMVGALLAAGRGQITPDDITNSLNFGSKAPPGKGGQNRGWTVAPAKGLSLYKVIYDPIVDDPSHVLYPEYPHDEWGRIVFSAVGTVNGREEDGGAMLASRPDVQV